MQNMNFISQKLLLLCYFISICYLFKGIKFLKIIKLGILKIKKGYLFLDYLFLV